MNAGTTPTRERAPEIGTTTTSFPTWRAVLAAPGRTRGDLELPAAVLERAAPLFVGVPLKVTWEPVGPRERVGRVADAWFEDGRLLGVVELHDPQARVRVAQCVLDGRPLELSFDAEVFETGGAVDAIQRVNELTIVRRGALGGRFLNLEEA